MKKTLFVVSLLVIASLILGVRGSAATLNPPRRGRACRRRYALEVTLAGTLFVVINKSADQQYFIDLQTSFVRHSHSFRCEPRRSSMPNWTRTWV